MSTKIDTKTHGYVTVTTEDDMGDLHTTTYFVRRDGEMGYVRIFDDAGRHPQVCELLSTRGNTLMATAETLPAVIKTELRRAKEAMKREQARW
jgi:hypothetical protein